ncbi:uncharacterized protein BX664DRAFT_50663 [Halteromyces radiatus]|uniref:uncharacterized protein n=1 Tax=Halteromyces radiatus TaxID=101107 RepID=UPI00221E98CB|nr:uncharacterized protein BX664DRAFT_50663 [Halteromyces radiatus]KAI8076333.1 hypothetical protein BX664DRAFT_50663 [Halteromyces radiatus]
MLIMKISVASLKMMDGKKSNAQISRKILLCLTMWIDSYMISTSEIYDVLKDSSRRYEDFNTRTIFYAVIYSMLFLLEASPNPLMSQQLEQWYQTNVWTPVTDKMLGNLPSVVGESASVASKERKRQQGKLYPERMGSRTDMVLRKTGNGIVLEYGT